MAQKKGLSYLYLSGMQAENPDSESKEDRDPLSESAGQHLSRRAEIT